MKRTFKTLGIFLSALFLLTACSSDDDTELIDELEKELGKDVGNLSNLLTPLYNPEDISWGGAPHYEQMGEWGTSIDDAGRYRGAQFYGTYDPIEKLYRAPSSVEDLNGIFFVLDKDYELRLDSMVEIPAWEGLPECSRRLDFYSEYYKGVPVYSGRYEFQFYGTTQGPRIINFTGWFYTFTNIDITPTISSNTAMKIFSKYQNATIDNTWKCKLYVREYNLQSKGKKVGVDQRLIYEVIGPPAQHYMDFGVYDMSANFKAEIDAHTGQIIVAGNSDFIAY